MKTHLALILTHITHSNLCSCSIYLIYIHFLYKNPAGFYILQIYCCVLIVSIGHASCTWPNKRVCPVSDQKHTVFRVIIKVTKDLVISRRTNI